MSRRNKSSSGDHTVGHSYVNDAERPSNNSKPVFETSKIERFPENGVAKWVQIWRFDSRGNKFLQWDSRNNLASFLGLNLKHSK